MSDPTHKITFPRLNEKNYGSWVGDERAELQRLGVWHIVKGTIVAPSGNDTEELRKWLIDSGKAAGSIYASLDPSQKVHVKGMEENPVSMWQALEKIHRQKKPGARFAAYNHLFSIQKLPEETLTALIGRVDDAITLIQDLRPAAHTLTDLDGELASMAMIRALPEEYQSFRSSLFLLPQLDKATVTEAFILEEQDRAERAVKGVAGIPCTQSRARSRCQGHCWCCTMCREGTLRLV
ncbi:Integrase catalytic domain-containing protein [Mycena sanguinolenta]|uniref:Integrase catalytic domain-containing protein n=1 Tax=Mycena sanguinolenta TaxID=230812 RepID=A0A8H7DN50_9AGAR|nr:Integrase catalytic domain-containing protein [Mycena sanguinolenta]